MAGPRVVLDFVPESFDSFREFFNGDSRFQVKREGHLASIHQGLYTFAADLESDRTLDATVCEVYIPEFGLTDTPVECDSQADILQFGPFEGLSGSCHRRLTVDVAFHLRLAVSVYFVASRHKSG